LLKDYKFSAPHRILYSIKQIPQKLYLKVMEKKTIKKRCKLKKKIVISGIFLVIISLILTLSFGGCRTEGAAATTAAAQAAAETEAASGGSGGLTIAIVVKNIGNPFFDVIKKGWDEACAELGDESIFRGPEQPTPEGQIEIIENLIAQKVDGFTYVANDPESLIPVAKKAMDAGIAVVGWESGVAKDSRNISVEPVSSQTIGADQVKIMADLIGAEGQVAILSAAATMANQNTWIDFMKEEWEKPEYANMELVGVVYGDDVREKSYNEALGLFKTYPDLKGIISPTSVGIAATARAITDEGMIDKVELTGLGLPSELAEYVHNGACKEFGLWNPIDLGYLNAYATHLIASGQITGAPGEEFDAGRLGHFVILEQEGVGNGLVYLSTSLFRFNKDNVDEFKDLL
jgi:rhamnose transport system substrate-binding protein